MNKHLFTLLTSVAAIAAISVQPAFAADQKMSDPAGVTQSASPMMKANSTSPKNLKEDAYVTLYGKVGKVLDKNAFELNYKGGTIKVSTDEAWGPLYDAKSAYMLKPGQNVTVTGSVDDGWFTRKEIQAYAIDVQGIGGKTYSYNRDAV